MPRGLLLRGRESPGGLLPALLAEQEAQLARRVQPLRAVGAERRAGLVEIERAEAMAREEALLARDLGAALDAARGDSCGHPSRPLLHDSVTGRAGCNRSPTDSARARRARDPQNAGSSWA